MLVDRYRQYSPIAAAVAIAFYATTRSWLASEREEQALKEQQHVQEDPTSPPSTPFLAPLSLDGPSSEHRISVDFQHYYQPLTSPVFEQTQFQPLETLWIHPPHASYARERFNDDTADNTGTDDVDDDDDAIGEECLILLVPGAPGIGVLYADLLIKVQAKQESPCTAQAISYPTTGPRASWDEVVEHVAAVFHAAFTNPRWKRGVIVLAQSMGAMFTAQALTQLLLSEDAGSSSSSSSSADGGDSIRSSVEAQLRGVQLITPFIDPRSTPRGPGLITILPWLRWTRLVQGMEGGLNFLTYLLSPERMGQGLAVVQRLRGYGENDPPGASAWFYTAFAARFKYSMIYRTQKLAYEAVYEGKVGPLAEQHPDVLTTLQTLTRKGLLCFHLADGDAWTSNFESYHQLLTNLKGNAGDVNSKNAEPNQGGGAAPVVRTHNVKHGFPQDSVQSAIVAASIAELTNAML